MTAPTPWNINTPQQAPNVAQRVNPILISEAKAFAKKRYDIEGIQFYNDVKEFWNKKAQLLGQFWDALEVWGRAWQILSQSGGTNPLSSLSSTELEEIEKAIKEETFRIWLPLIKQRDTFMHFLDTRFVLDKKQRKKVLEGIEKKSVWDIEKLQKSAVWDGFELKKFFQKTLKWDVPQSVDFTKFIYQFDIDLTKISERQKTIMFSLYDIHQRDVDMSIEEVKELFSWPNALFKTSAQKKKFLKFFFPTVTLKQLYDLWVVKDSHILKLAENILAEEGAKFWVKKADILSLIDMDKVTISSSTLRVNNTELNQIFEWPALEQLIAQLNAFKENVYTKEAWNNPPNFATLKERLTQLSKQWKSLLKDTEQLKKWNIVEMQYQIGEEMKKEYYKIIEVDVSLSDKEKWIEFSLVWEDDKVYTDGERKTFKKSYWEIEGTFSWDKKTEDGTIVSVVATDIWEFSKKTQSYVRAERMPNVKTMQALDSEIDAKWYETKQIEDRIKDIWAEIHELETQISMLWIRDEDKKEDLRPRIKLLKAEREQLKSIQESRIKEIDVLEEQVSGYEKVTYQNLVDRYNKIDFEGKNLGLEIGVHIVPKDPKSGLWWIVEDFDRRRGHIILKNARWIKETITFEDFIEQSEKKWYKRIHLKNFDDLKARMSWYSGSFETLKNSFNDLKLHDNQLYVDTGKAPGKKDKPLKYLVTPSSQWSYVIKIHEIKGDRVVISTWKLKEKLKLHKDRTVFEKPEVSYQMSNSTTELTLSQFYQIVSGYWYTPQKDWLVEVKEEELKNPSMESSLWKRFRQWYSFATMVHGIHLIGESIHESFEHGDHVIAAHFALSLWKFLPSEERRRDLQEKVEMHEKEETEKYVKKLWAVDSSVASKRIYSWIINKDTPTYQLEAAVTFMYQKYGSLYMKAWLEGKRGQWLWYKAFWGTPGDTFYREKEKECRDRDIPFTEEKLVYWWIQRVCKSHEPGNHHIHGTRHLRSRLHKELKWMWPQGISKEGDDGAKDAGDIRTTSAQLEFMMSELGWWSHANVFWDGKWNGAFEKLIWRWGPAWHYEMIPFVCFFSGEIYSMDEKVIRHIKNISAKWMVNVAPLFMSKYHHMNEYNNAMLDLCQDIQEAYPDQFPSISDELVSMYKDSFNYMGDPTRKWYGSDRKSYGARFLEEPWRKKRLKTAFDFFTKYGDVITNCLYTANGTGKYNRVRKVMVTKDNQNYKTFRETLEVGTAMATNFAAEKQLITDSYADSWYTGIFWKKAANDVLWLKTGWVFRNENDVTTKIWGEMVKDIDTLISAPTWDFWTNPWEDRLNRIKITALHIRDIFAHFLWEEGNKQKLEALMMSSSAPWDSFQRWGLTYEDIVQFNEESVERPDSMPILEKIAKRILDKGSLIPVSSQSLQSIWVQNWTAVGRFEETQNKVNETLTRKSWEWRFWSSSMKAPWRRNLSWFSEDWDDEED